MEIKVLVFKLDMKINEKLLKEKSSIKLYLSGNYTYTDKNPKKLTLIQETSKGSNLSLSNGGVKIGKGITHVLVTGQVYFFTGVNHNDGKCCHIYKNSTKVSGTHNRINLNYIHVNASTIVPVTEDDIIYLYAQNDTTNQTVIAGGDGNTYLNVVEL
jgi:hypothetical protein|nr:MAG TPA: hypothetical protein [Caudoviricetes sp.]